MIKTIQRTALAVLAMVVFSPAARAADVPVDTIKAMLTPYFAVQNALSEDDLAVAKKQAEELGKVSGAPETITVPAKELAGAADLKVARSSFEKISNVLIPMVAANKNSLGTEVHRMFCPMAMGRGAHWLQAIKAVRNPYEGKAMQSCGSEKPF